MPTTYRIHKVLSKDADNTIGMLRRPDGSLTKGSREVLDLLMLTHFPGTVELTDINQEVILPQDKPRIENWNRSSSIVTHERVSWKFPVAF
jgi:hypothetical protein